MNSLKSGFLETLNLRNTSEVRYYSCKRFTREWVIISIQSNFLVAQHHATSIGNAVETLTTTSSISLDCQTTVAGNNNAKQAITDLNQSVTMLVSIVNNASKNIQSVASDFERLDQHIASQNRQIVAPLLGKNKPLELPK